MKPSERFRGPNVLPTLLLVGLVALVYHYFWWCDAAGNPKLKLHWDFEFAYYPWFVYVTDTLRAGIWPLWCPYVGCGTPFFINPAPQIFSPITLAVALTSGYTLWVAQVQEVVAIGVAALGARALASALGCSPWGAFVAGACYGLSSAVFGNLEHGVFINGYALMTWLFWLLHRLLYLGGDRREARDSERRRALVGLPLVYYLLITCASVFQEAHVVAWSFVWAAYLVQQRGGPAGERLRGLATVLAAATLALVTATAYWLPVASSLGEILRGAPLPPERALHGGSLSWSNMLGLVFGFMTTHPLGDTYAPWSMIGIYVGALALPLVAIAAVRRHDRWSLPLAVLAVVSLGMALGENSALSIWAHRLIPPMNFSRFPAGDNRTLFALGLVLMAGRGWTTLEAGDRPARRIGLAALVVVLGVLASAWGWLLPLYAPAEAEKVWPYLLAQVEIAAVAVLCWWRAEQPVARALYLALMVLDLAIGFRANLYIAGEAPPPDYVAGLRREHVTTFDVAPALVPRRPFYGQAMASSFGSIDQNAVVGYTSKRFFVGEYNPLRMRRLQRLEDLGLAGYLEQGARVAFWPGSAPPTTAPALLAGLRPLPFTILRYRPNDVDYTVQAAAPGLLVFNELYFPGWRARVDGHDMAMLPVLDGLRALPVGPGPHRVESYFHPDVFYRALGVSAGGLALWLLWLGWMLRRGKTA